MENLIIGVVTSAGFTVLVTMFGRYLDNNRKDKNDRMKEYRFDNAELKRELKKIQEKLNIVEEERTRLRIENMSMKKNKEE